MMKALLQLAAISSRIITLFASIAAEQDYRMQKFLTHSIRFAVILLSGSSRPSNQARLAEVE
jgi:hypothetical protein